MSRLNIYKASAGSGKTFALTLEYFRIIFSVPAEYKNILAVTFTNKATGEMKSRIIKELNRLAEGQSSSYGPILQNEFRLTDEQLKNRAIQLRTMLLHDYGRISVTTIDRFFQRIIKSFTHELGIFPGYNVELDSDFVLLKAVDKVMEEVKDKPELRFWIGELMTAGVEEGKSWRIKARIVELGEELFKENYMLLDDKILTRFSDKDFLKEYQLFLRNIVREYEETLSLLGEKAVSLIESNGLELQDFKGGKNGCAGHFYKLKAGKLDDVTSTARQAVGDTGYWITKSCVPETRMRIESVFPELNRILASAIETYDTRYRYYLSARQLIANLYQLGILNDLYKKVREYCDEKGIMLLSDTTRILNILIEGNDTSFLFEKTGNYYKHLMIDEFQDTSSLQWRNFRPLVVNTLAEGNQAMIVGDVKQSIYRWRNGDWRLLASRVEDEFARLGTNDIILQNNWRSAREIVDFNNVFFREAALELKALYDHSAGEDNAWSEAIVQAYDNLEQVPKRELGGYVDILFGPSKKEEDADTQIMASVTEVIADITRRGGQQKDIVILVRNAKEGAFAANYFMEYNTTASQKINFVSNDSLYVRSSAYVRFIVAVLRYMAEPYDIVNKASILLFYYSSIKCCNADKWDAIFKAAKEEELFRFLNSDFTFNSGKILSYSLFETVKAIIDKFSLKDKKEEVPYLIAFQDIVFEYESNNSNSIILFLEWWEKEQMKKVLSTSEDIDAVRILTIHKAKGLEFEHVILPFCSWELDATQPLRRIWCTTREDKFNELEYAPLNYSAKLADTIFKDDYFDEHLKAYVDNLNLLYVALTRAERELYVRPYRPKINKDGSLTVGDIGTFMYQVLERLKGKEQIHFCPDGEMNLQYGTKYQKESTVSEQKPLVLEHYAVYDSEERISIRYKYQDYTDPDQDTRSAVDEGKLLHEIFRMIESEEDVEKALRQMCLNGLISLEDKAVYRAKIEKYLCRPEVSAWFSSDFQVVNERDILFGGGDKVRPDRVLLKGNTAWVIDYKFGNKEEEKYKRQVRYYCHTLQKMGYTSVKGYIWYVVLDKVVPVE